MSAAVEYKLRWKSQPRQLKFLRACGLAHPFDGGKPRQPAADIVGYGGAAGGGKSDALMMAAIIYCCTYTKAKIGYFRRTFVQLAGPGGAIMRSEDLLHGLAKYNEQKRRWKFPNGSILQFCYLQRDQDVHNYQSQQFDVILFDEATQFTSFQVNYMQSRIRSVRGYPTFCAMATNPGGIGHYWFKTQFVKAGEEEEPHDVEIEPGKFRSHIFIPATLSDNHILEKMDPKYRKKLESMPQMLRQQLLDGDWDVAEGMAFTEWRTHIHVIPPFKIPDDWIRFRSADWGYSKPYCIGWYAIDQDGRIYKYREMYGWGGRDNVGSNEDPSVVARKIMKAEKGEKIAYAVCDDAMFGGRQDKSRPIGEQLNVIFGGKHTHFVPVGKGKGSRVSGKTELHTRLRVPEIGEAEEEPMLLFFNTCYHTIRTIPNLILDENNPEDIDTTLEDHAYDETRYAMMSRPMKAKPRKPKLSPVERHKQSVINKRKSITRRVG